MTLGTMNHDAEREDLIQLEPLVHQVSGHSSMFVLDDVTVCKPLIGREFRFYRTLPPEMKRYTPDFRGTLQVLLQDEGEGITLAALPNEQMTYIRNNQGAFEQRGCVRRVSSSSVEFESDGEEDRSGCHGESDDAALEAGQALSTTHPDTHNPWLQQCHQTTLNKLKMKCQPSNVVDCIMLENLTFKYQYPCVLDLKMGTRQYGDDATESKRKSQTAKAAKTTTVTLGARMAGMQVYNKEKKCYHCKNKYFGQQLSEDGFRKTLREFLHNGQRLRTEIAELIVAKLEELRSIISKLDSVRFFTSSLLILYDGGDLCGARLGRRERERDRESNSNRRMRNEETSIFMDKLKAKDSNSPSRTSKHPAYIQESPGLCESNRTAREQQDNRREGETGRENSTERMMRVDNRREGETGRESSTERITRLTAREQDNRREGETGRENSNEGILRVTQREQQDNRREGETGRESSTEGILRVIAREQQDKRREGETGRENSNEGMMRVTAIEQSNRREGETGKENSSEGILRITGREQSNRREEQTATGRENSDERITAREQSNRREEETGTGRENSNTRITAREQRREEETERSKSASREQDKRREEETGRKETNRGENKDITVKTTVREHSNDGITKGITGTREQMNDRTAEAKTGLKEQRNDGITKGITGNDRTETKTDAREQRNDGITKGITGNDRTETKTGPKEQRNYGITKGITGNDRTEAKTGAREQRNDGITKSITGTREQMNRTPETKTGIKEQGNDGITKGITGTREQNNRAGNESIPKARTRHRNRKCKPTIDIRMIDFAHATHKDMGDSKIYSGPDEGILLGLESLITIFKDIIGSV